MQNKEIQGAQYRLNLFGASEAIDLLPQVSKVLIKPLGNVVDSIPFDQEDDISDIELSEIDGAELSQAAINLVESIDEAGGSRFLRKLMKGVMRHTQDCEEVAEEWAEFDPAKNQSKYQFDQIYKDNLQELVKVLWWVIKENYGSLLEGKGFQALKKMTNQQAEE